MPAGTSYAKRYAGGFADGSGGATPIDSVFLNAVEAALLQLLGSAPTVDGQVAQWDAANTRFGPALLLNKNVDPAAAIAKSKLDLTGANGIVNADIAAAAAISKSKLAALGIVDADVAAGAAIALTKLAGYPADATKFARGDNTWAVPLNSVKVVTGVIPAAGTAPTAGTGFTYTHASAGVYVFTFNPVFAAVPTVVVTVNNPGLFGMCDINALSASSFEVNTFSSAFAASDRGFNFIAYTTA